MSSHNEQKVYETLNALNIEFSKHVHPPVFTVEEANMFWSKISGLHCKNLFLRNKKGNRHYLLILSFSKQVVLKDLYSTLGERVSFGSSERLQKYLGLTPGSVSPFGLINDLQKEVIVLLDEDIKSANEVNFHPNVNTVTLTIKKHDFDKFMDYCGNEVRYLNV